MKSPERPTTNAAVEVDGEGLGSWRRGSREVREDLHAAVVPDDGVVEAAGVLAVADDGGAVAGDPGGFAVDGARDGVEGLHAGALRPAEGPAGENAERGDTDDDRAVAACARGLGLGVGAEGRRGTGKCPGLRSPPPASGKARMSSGLENDSPTTTDPFAEMPKGRVADGSPGSRPKS